MANALTRPIQVFLDTQRLIQTQPTGTRGPNKDFFAGNNAAFQRHKAKIRAQLAQASEALRDDDDPAGFILVQMREEGLGKSYRPLNALFTARNRFALVGGADIGQMYFQVTPNALDGLSALIEARAEVIPREVENPETQRIEERVSAYRSELGAIDEVRLPTPADRLAFSARDAVTWLEQVNVIGGYIVELFRPDARVTPDAVMEMVAKFEGRLRDLPGVVAKPLSTKGAAAGIANLALSIDLQQESESQLDLPLLLEGDEPAVAESSTKAGLRLPRDRSVSHHQRLLDILANEPLVRRIELPLQLEAAPAGPQTSDSDASIPQPVPNQSYPIVGIIDAGVADLPGLAAWRAGGVGFLTPGDRDEEHGTFIAGLLTAGAALNPHISDRLEQTPTRYYDIDIFPRQGRLTDNYDTPDDFFDQLDTQVAAAKAQLGVRVFNMSLGSPRTRQGLGYSSFAAHLDRIARAHDVIFVVSAGNLRDRARRPEWPADADNALEMLATRAIAEERITAPGEHLYGLTVGAINPPGATGVVAVVPTAYTRRGPGPGGARKPELAQIGGASSRGGNNTGLFSCGADGKLVDSSGTSFATPLVTSTVATLDHRLEGLAPRETILALSVHRAVRPRPLLAKQLATVARDFVGFGVPVNAERALSDDPHTITLVFADVLPPRRELSFTLTWPRSLIMANGKCRGRVDITLAHTPPIDAAFDAECQRAQLSATLLQLEEKMNRDGELVADHKQRLKACDTKLPEHLHATERALLESGLKWTPIKRYELNMPKGCGQANEWRLALKSLTRAGAIYPEEGVPFALLMTISDPSGTAQIYEEVRTEVLRRGLRLADITVAQRIRTRA